MKSTKSNAPNNMATNAVYVKSGSYKMNISGLIENATSAAPVNTANLM